MMPRGILILASTAFLGLLGCEADRQAAETTPGFDAPATVEQAPAAPITTETMRETELQSDTSFDAMATDTATDSIAAPPN